MTFTLMRGDKGWAMPLQARRQHFFREDGRSECGKFVVPAGLDNSAFTAPTGDEKPAADDCSACWDRLRKRPVEPPT